VPALKKLAENYIRADRPADALKLYVRLEEKDHDHYTLENYALLAEAQEDNEQLLAAEALAARRERTAEAYLNIATTGRNMDDRDAAISLLQEGIAALPESAALRIGLAELLALEDEEDDAVEVLMHPSVKHSYAGLSALLALSEFVPNKSALLNFVGDDLEKRFDLSMQTRFDLAVVCHQVGETERCERLFASVSQGKDTWRACAAARFDIGAYEEAARLMKLHLQDQRRATSDDWVFLGDIYDLMGRNDDARDAYNFSLTLLTSDLPETAYREPTSAAVHPVKPNTTIP
jgi:tetratricopeptide (TPR) repeat protein